MFRKASSFDQDISEWDMSSVSDMEVRAIASTRIPHPNPPHLQLMFPFALDHQHDGASQGGDGLLTLRRELRACSHTHCPLRLVRRPCPTGYVPRRGQALRLQQGSHQCCIFGGQQLCLLLRMDQFAVLAVAAAAIAATGTADFDMAHLGPQ